MDNKTPPAAVCVVQPRQKLHIFLFFMALNARETCGNKGCKLCDLTSHIKVLASTLLYSGLMFVNKRHILSGAVFVLEIMTLFMGSFSKAAGLS